MIEEENIRNFEDDLNESNSLRLRNAWERIIRYKFGNDCKIFWKDTKDIQLGLGTDITIVTSKGRRYSVELKTRNSNCFENQEYIMEIVSHIYDRKEKPRIHLRSKEGWIYSTTAEYIFHGTKNEAGDGFSEVIFYSLRPFKLESYKSNFEQYENLWLPTLFDNGTFQLTLNKLIPKIVIKSDSEEYWEWKNGST